MPRQSQLSFFARPVRKARPPSEFAKHCVIADIVRLFAMPGWKWTHLPFGEHRSPATAGRLKRMGVNPGWPDFLFVSPTGQHHYVELKRTAEKGSVAQEDMRRFLEAGHVPYLMSTSVNVILSRLRDWGALRPDARW